MKSREERVLERGEGPTDFVRPEKRCTLNTKPDPIDLTLSEDLRGNRITVYPEGTDLDREFVQPRFCLNGCRPGDLCLVGEQGHFRDLRRHGLPGKGKRSFVNSCAD